MLPSTSETGVLRGEVDVVRTVSPTSAQRHAALTSPHLGVVTARQKHRGLRDTSKQPSAISPSRRVMRMTHHCPRCSSR